MKLNRKTLILTLLALSPFSGMAELINPRKTTPPHPEAALPGSNLPKTPLTDSGLEDPRHRRPLPDGLHSGQLKLDPRLHPDTHEIFKNEQTKQKPVDLRKTSSGLNVRREIEELRKRANEEVPQDAMLEGTNQVQRVNRGGSSPFLRILPTSFSPNLVFGSMGNQTGDTVIGATVSGGGDPFFPNLILGDYGTVGGGLNNQAGSPRELLGTPFATVAGGRNNLAGDRHAFVGGGMNNVAGGLNSSVTAGYFNEASDTFSAVVGGRKNLAGEELTFVGGGYTNRVEARLGSITGGERHRVDGVGGHIGGGAYNHVSGDYGVVPGGRFNVAGGLHSFAAGRGARAMHPGSFVWSDGSEESFASTATGQFLLRAEGNVGIDTTSPEEKLSVAGNIAPAQDDSHNLGSNRLRWNSVYLSHALEFYDTLHFKHEGQTVMSLDRAGNLHLRGTLLAGDTVMTPPSAGTVTNTASTLATGLDAQQVRELIKSEAPWNGSIAQAEKRLQEALAKDAQRNADALQALLPEIITNTATRISQQLLQEQATKTATLIAGELAATRKAYEAADTRLKAEWTMRAEALPPAPPIAAPATPPVDTKLVRRVVDEALAAVKPVQPVAPSESVRNLISASATMQTRLWRKENNQLRAELQDELDRLTREEQAARKQDLLVLRNEVTTSLQSLKTGVATTPDADSPARSATGPTGLRVQFHPISPAWVAGHASNEGLEYHGALVVGGGTAEDPNIVSDTFGVVAGGLGNEAGLLAVAAGGAANRATGPSSVVIGGFTNLASKAFATVSGGANNTASARFAHIGGGSQNEASGHASTIAGGSENQASGEHSVIPGGKQNRAGGANSWAGGTASHARHKGAFVWADATGKGALSMQENEARFTTRGGFVVQTQDRPEAAVMVAPGGHSWNYAAGKSSQLSRQALDVDAVLNALNNLEINAFRLPEQAETIYHAGPTAEDFRKSFGLGESAGHINAADADAMAYAAIQGLSKQVKAQQERIANLEKRLAGLEKAGR